MVTSFSVPLPYIEVSSYQQIFWQQHGGLPSFSCSPGEEKRGIKGEREKRETRKLENLLVKKKNQLLIINISSHIDLLQTILSTIVPVMRELVFGFTPEIFSARAPCFQEKTKKLETHTKKSGGF